MSVHGIRGWRASAPLGIVAVWAAVCVAGCSQQDAGAPESPDKPKAVAVPAAAALPANFDPKLHQPFSEAAITEPPDGQLRPPDQTKAGKNVAKLYEAIVGKDGKGGLWDQIKFTSPAGKRYTYKANIKTDLGDIIIDLWPDVAPNHVRNFVCLAQVGYYEGLEFDRTVREEFEGQKGKALEYIEAGCPLGLADPGIGNIGYWLKPELSTQVKHVAGTVGAWHAEEVETAACKFYITLDEAPWMDGNWTVFGKVSQGLDVARAIRARPVREDEKDRPQQPVVIRSVTVVTAEVEPGDMGGKAP
jgi:peptidyl-prolyl cis-trans isomerase B (cyclophilin B)